MPGARGARNTTRRTASTPGAGALTLVVLGDEATPAFPLDAPNLLVGRAPDNDIVLGEASVSARHARIDLRDGLVYLTDLGSTNGTFVAGRRVTGSVELQPGDTVALGRCQVRVEGSPGPGTRPTEHRSDPEPSTAPYPPAREMVQSPSVVEPPPPSEWLAALQLATEAPVGMAARQPLRLLISFDPATPVDVAAAGMLAGWLTRLGHQVRAHPSAPTRNARPRHERTRDRVGDGSGPGSGRGPSRRDDVPHDHAGRAMEVDGQTDPWAGRLLEVMWATDVVLFMVSEAAATSPRVHREVHLAGAERTMVVPVLMSPAAGALPEDLAYYLQLVPPADLQHDPAAGLTTLQGRLETCRPKRVARPWQLARRIAAVGSTVIVVGLVLAFLVF